MAVAAAGQDTSSTPIQPECGFISACGSTGCYDANIATCVDGSCTLQDPLPDEYQTIVDTGISSLESLTEQACTIPTNVCDGILYDSEDFYCVNNVNIVAKGSVLPCGNLYCESDQACSETEDGEQTCEDISTLCGDRDKETLCSVESGVLGEYYAVLLTKDKTGNLYFRGESSTWGIGSFSLDYICDVNCNAGESTPAPAPSAAMPITEQGALLLMVSTTTVLAMSLIAI